MGASLMAVLVAAMAAPSSAVHYNYHPAVYARTPPAPQQRAPAYAPPPVQLWFLTPSEVAELVSRIPLSDYREVSPHAPVAARYTPADRHLLRQEQVDVSQFHTQDGAGRAVFGYSTADQVRVEARSGDGRVRGSYSYRDPTGKVVKVNYWDDGDGFHVAGNSLPSESDVPEPVTETPEVAAARLQHESLHAQALQSALLAGNGEETDQTRVEGPSGDLPPVYDEDGTELRRYPAPQHASLYDPSHVHDVERDAVIISNPDLEPDSFNDIQLFRSRVGAAASSAGTPSAAASARARGYHPRQRQQQVDAHGRARRQTQHDDEQQEQQQPPPQQKADGFYYSFRYPAPVLVGVPPPPQAGTTGVDTGRTPADEQPLSLSQRAVYFGAIPVAAVHDAQVAPGQRGYGGGLEYANKPVYTEANA